MYSMCIEGITFRLENDHTKLTVMVPHDRHFPFRVIQRVVPSDYVFSLAQYYREDVFMDLIVPDDTVCFFNDRIKDVKNVSIFYRDKRYEIDTLAIEYRYPVNGDSGGLYIAPDTMSKFLVQ